MKIVVLHPPLYPVNHKFFDELGKKVELVVYSFGSQPGLHKHWKAQNFIHEDNNYKLKIIEGSTNLKRLAVSYRTQLNPRFLKDVYKEKPDLVISVAFWFPSLYMSFFKKYLSCKLVILTDAIAQTEKNNSKLRVLIRKLIAKNTDAFIASSDLTVEYLNKKFPKATVKKSIQTIDIEEWKRKVEKLPKKALVRNQLKLPDDKTILLSIGNFIELKNLGKLIDLVKNLDNCILILLGEGELKKEFQAKIMRYEIQDKVKLVSRKEGDALKMYFKASDMFIFPSKRDTFGYVVVEALASGLPVICSKNAGASTLIEQGENGFIIDPNKSFTNEILKVINNLPDISENARNSISTYTLKNKADEFFQILTNLNQ